MEERRGEGGAPPKVKKVTINAGTGKSWWQQPDILWRKVSFLQAMRLRATVKSTILPVLQEIESLYHNRETDGPKYLVGKTLAQIEEDPVSIEAGLQLFHIAHSMGFIEFGKKSNGPNGSCGMSIKQASAFFIRLGAVRILNKAGHDAKKLDEYMSEDDLEEISCLKALRKLVLFDALSIKELRLGLLRHYPKLFEKDEEFLECLMKCKAVNFLRALRLALGTNFVELLNWETDFIEAVAHGLDHSAKIIALGHDLLHTTDPATVLALGKWPVKEVIAEEGSPRDKKKQKKKTYVTKIGDVKKALGSEFEKVIAAGPEMIDLVAELNKNDLELLKHHIPNLSPSVLDILSPLDFKEKIGLLDGLWDRLGRDFMENTLKEEPGAQVVELIVEALEKLKEHGSKSDDVKAIVSGGLFDEHMESYLPR